MPDKHEVGGSSPLGPTRKDKDSTRAKLSTRRPRAFVERAEYLNSNSEAKRKGLGVFERAEAPARHKHRHEVLLLD